MSFAKSLDRKMTERGISNYELGKAIGKSNSLISRWRRGETNPTIDAVIAVSEYMAISLDELVGRESKINTAANLDGSIVDKLNEAEASGMTVELTEDQFLRLLDSPKIRSSLKEYIHQVLLEDSE